MELVYLWVEDYKNIKKQGFNFSPRFHCDYDGETLTIDKNNDYIPDFFGENINVTAIVGKNGSGKSSILDNILNSISGSSTNFLIFYEDNKLFQVKSTNNQKTMTISSNLSVIKAKQDFLELDMLYFDTENKCPPIRADIIERIENPSVYDGFTDMLYMDEYHEEYRDDSKVIIDEYKVGQKLIELLIKDKNICNDFFLFDIRDFVILENNRYFFDLEYDMSFCVNHDEFSQENTEKYNFIKEKNYNLYLLHMFYSLEIHDRFFNECIKEDRDNKYIVDYRIIYSILDEYNEKAEITLAEYIKFEKILFDKEGYIDIDDIFSLKDIHFKFYTFTPYDKKNRTLLDLSYGEKNIISQFIFLLHKVIFSNKKNILIVLDEIDISLHPSWQKRYIYELIKIFMKIDKNIHIILSTHSPFLLSDIPKQNIIFLDKDEQGNCKVVDGLNDKKQTFGANIHTLLSDSFFMEDGLMGEFAKKKIDKVITILNQEKPTQEDLEYCGKIIPIIGEPIVKNQLQKMLDSQKLPKVGEIDKIHEEIEALQSRLKDLEVKDDKK